MQQPAPTRPPIDETLRLTSRQQNAYLLGVANLVIAICALLIVNNKETAIAWGGGIFGVVLFIYAVLKIVGDDHGGRK
jgi:hypothetical protein